MAFRKKLPSGDTVTSWQFENDSITGMSVGVFDKELGRGQMLVCVEEYNGEKRIVISETRAEKYGFKIVWEV